MHPSTEIPSQMFHIYILITIYVTFISVDADFDVDSDSGLGLELGARLGLAFGETRAFACFCCDSPVRCTKGYISGAPFREILGDDPHVSFEAGTADDVPCAGRTPERGVASQDRKIRRSGTKVTSVLNVL